jgi:hypothetical protein
MPRKDRIDLTGFSLLVALSLLLGVNQIAIKLSSGGFNPAFGSGISWAAVACIARVLSSRGVVAETQIVWMAGVSAPLPAGGEKRLG